MYSLHFKEKLGHDFDSALESFKLREQISTECSVKQIDVDFCVDNRSFYQIGYSVEINADSVYYRDYDVLDTKGNYYWMYLDECGNK